MFISWRYSIIIRQLLGRNTLYITSVSIIESSYLLCLYSILVFNAWLYYSTFMFINNFIRCIILWWFNRFQYDMTCSSWWTVRLIFLWYTLSLFMITLKTLDHLLIWMWTRMLFINPNNFKSFYLSLMIILQRQWAVRR